MLKHFLGENNKEHSKVQVFFEVQKWTDFCWWHTKHL